MFMDISSEMVHALLPLFLTTALGASVALVGLIDGIAESAASISKVFSGYLSDRFRRRKPFILIGYGLGALTKPLFAIAGTPAMVLGARFADRIGKGLRGAPRAARQVRSRRRRLAPPFRPLPARFSWQTVLVIQIAIVLRRRFNVELHAHGALFAALLTSPNIPTASLAQRECQDW